ncbi:unnamed protein product [Didymodactylos carnosus]|uniref:Nuclear receptor domain-containing protein n=1 Tax=Didymodactylos carnosus TaxID=1234261 RepID=A0A815MD60_9BILA|nr:unnamed protein product [Didymodactylos carnosus]CAF4304968.1 unnamed protein product [Didymodactylos carnosus]
MADNYQCHQPYSNDIVSEIKDDVTNDRQDTSNTNIYTKKKIELMCVVCGAPAIGYNFDQITCESCKAFFRRNALKSLGTFKCRCCTGVSDVNILNRKRCKACRLQKCFAKGMRKEWILSDEQKRSKKQKMKENRRVRQLNNCLTEFEVQVTANKTS